MRQPRIFQTYPFKLLFSFLHGKKDFLNVRIEQDPGDHLLLSMPVTDMETEAQSGEEAAPPGSQG